MTDKRKITVNVNGKSHTKDVSTRLLLSDFLRHELLLTGTHVGCDTSQCGCCTVLVSDAAVSGCLYLAVFADGADVKTIEYSPEGKLDAVQESFIECGAFQCGYCTPGFVMAAKGFLDKHPNPTL